MYRFNFNRDDVKVTDEPLWQQYVNEHPEELEDAFAEMLEQHKWFALELELRAERAEARHRADGATSSPDVASPTPSPGGVTRGDLAA